MAKKKSTSGLELGSIVQDTYEVLERLGEGGMGAAYKARHIALNHFVCIKVISEAYSRDPKALDLFKREANLLRELGAKSGSDAIVKIETLLRDASGAHFLIMEYIDGQPLSHYINLGARLRDDDLVALAKRLLQGLTVIHDKNIVHRDISPDNIMVPADDILQAKILDFGLASDVAGTEKSIIGDSFAGKISYASPEQLGLFGGKVTPKSDLYSLGLVLVAVAGLPIPGKGSMAAAVETRRLDLRIEDSRLSAQTARKIEALLRAQPDDRQDLFTSPEPEALPTSKPVAAAAEVQGAQKKTTPRKAPALFLGVFAAAIGGAGVFFAISKGGEQMADPPALVESTPSPLTTTTPPEPLPTSENQEETNKEEVANPDAETRQPAETNAIESPSLAAEPLQPATTDVPEAQPAPTAIQIPSIEAAENLIALADDASIITAAEILAEISADTSREKRERAIAFALTGWVYDPQYRRSSIASLNAPDAKAALTAYESARDLGLFEVQPEINRLSAIIQE